MTPQRYSCSSDTFRESDLGSVPELGGIGLQLAKNDHQLDDIQAPFPEFILPDERGGLAQFHGQIGLRHTSFVPKGNQCLQKGAVRI